MDTDIGYLLSLQAVRERANRVFELAEQDKLNHFSYDPERLSIAADFVTKVISRDFGPDRYEEIPPHGRWQHFNVGDFDRVSILLGEIEGDKKEQTRVLMDLFFVSVLLDAGAGDKWQFQETGSDKSYGRSEGIAVASLHAFRKGSFSSDPKTRMSVDAQGLVNLSDEAFLSDFQVSEANPMVGTEARVQLLRSVGKSLLALPDIFGSHGRPGNLVDYMLQTTTEQGNLNYETLWSVLQRVLIPSWPKNRTHVHGQPIGDAWPLQALAGQIGDGGSTAITSKIQPFHKLTQWLAYSLVVPFVRLLNLRWTNMDLGTGLPEYRNGGLFVDLKVLKLKPDTLSAGQKASGQDLPIFDASSDVIVEWRALTVALLDRLHVIISKEFASQGVQLSMAQMLEAGTWKSGRELAALHRPHTKSSPILIDGDGTLF